MAAVGRGDLTYASTSAEIDTRGRRADQLLRGRPGANLVFTRLGSAGRRGEDKLCPHGHRSARGAHAL
jgi:hypothetical protein